MRNTRGRDTPPELALRKALFKRGLRYRVNARPIPELRRSADVVFPGRRLAIFVDGCFWHGCPQHFKAPKINVGYWAPKIEGNRRRDAETTEALKAAGWRVVRVWEHDDPKVAADEIELLVRHKGSG